MRNLNDIIKCKEAKTKKSIGGIFAAIVVIVVAVSIFSEGGAFIGILFGVGILAAVSTGVYFWLNAIDELPDSF